MHSYGSKFLWSQFQSPRGFGGASAHLYSSVDDILHSIIENDSSTSECELPLPAHFIMGGMHGFGRPCHNSPFPCHLSQVHHPSLSMSHTIQKRRLTYEMRITYILDAAEDGCSLQALDVIGRYIESLFPRGPIKCD